MKKFKGKYRIPSARWAAWDYGSNAAYFVTICIANCTHDFGEIVNSEMSLTPLGQAAVDCWEAIPDHFPFVVLDRFVVMPNHVHGIIIIDKPDGGVVETPDGGGVVETQDVGVVETPDGGVVETPDGGGIVETPDGGVVETPDGGVVETPDGGVVETPDGGGIVETQDVASLPPKNRFGPQSQNLASIVRGYKIGVTKYARQHNLTFKWQARYHDHVIRNAGEYERIQKYIRENSQKWNKDRYHTL